MRYQSISRFIVVLLITATFACSSVTASPITIPDPIVDAPLATAKSDETIVLAGGCFWGIQAVFQHVKGVKEATSGYAGGSAKTADYEKVSSGTTGHAESVEIIYDPSQVSIGQLLKVFFSVAHNPTQLNRQGPDAGTQYRSAIFFKNADHKRIAQAYIDQLNQAKVFNRPIVTQLAAYNGFYKAEAYHQDYATRHPDEPYIAINDLPKVENLRKQFPNLYVSR
jgi:peptide-methionine (S)-S-oxide reductase